MKQLISVLAFFTICCSVYGQQKEDDDYLKEWQKFKKENAPFNKEHHTYSELEDAYKQAQIQLGDLKYKRENYTLGQELLGVALHITAAFYEETQYQNRIAKDPARYFIPDYYNK